MEEQLHQAAASANRAVYDSGWTEIFVEGAPHLKHASLRALLARLLGQVYERAVEQTPAPRVLDLGAGEGSVTRQLLELGARVTAIDVSPSQLAELERKCERFGDRLETRCGDVSEVLHPLPGPYDIVVASACLHHLPDYLAVIADAIAWLAPHGQFLSFQDPLRCDTVGRFARMFSEVGYLSWRVFQGDLWGGFKRRLRRSRGILDDSVLDNAEYHIIRNGVDQDAIAALLTDADFDLEIVRYFSTQSRLFQPLGEALGIKNTFAVIATRHSNTREATV